MRKMMTRAALPFALALLAGACNESGSSLNVRPEGEPQPIGVENGLFFAADGRGEEESALTVDLAAAEPRLHDHALPSPLLRSLARPGEAHGGKQVVVLTSGRPAREVKGKREDALNSHLLIFDRERELLRHALSARYNQVALSDDGRFAVAFQPTGSVVLQNAIEVVDLDKVAAAPGTPSAVVNLQFDGRAPTSLIFSPTSAASAFMRRILVVPFTNAVLLLDLEHPERGEISIPLNVGSGAASLTPEEFVFAGDQIFVRVSGSNQVLALQLLPAATKHGFQIAPSQLPTAANITDLALVGTGAGLRVLALAGSLEIFDPNVGSATRIDATRGFGAILPFEGSSPVDTNSQPRALVYSSGQSQVGFVDLGSDSAWAARAIELVELGEPLSRVVPLTTRKLALGVHGANRVSVIDLQERTVTPVALSEALSSTLLDETAARARLWLLTRAGTLAVLDLDALTTSEVPISFDLGYGGWDQDASADEGSVGLGGGRLLLVPGAPRRVAVLHASDTGHVTLLDADHPTRESAQDLVGFFLEGLFD